MPKTKRTDKLAPKIKTAQTLFFINTFIWFCLGTYLALDMLHQNNGLSAVLVGFFFYVNAGAMLVSGMYLGKRETWAYYFSLIILIVNALVTRIGQFGLLDLLELIFDLVIFGVLISFGKAYLNKS